MGELLHLFLTPRSHFARKVRLLLDHLAIEYDMVDLVDVTKNQQAHFKDSPIMTVPILNDNGTQIFESDYIAEYIVRKFDPKDRYAVLDVAPDTRNIRAVINSAMGNHAKIILARRTGIDTSNLPFFQKAETSIYGALDWLNARAEDFKPHTPTYTEFMLVSMWGHIALYDAIGPKPSKLTNIVASLDAQPLVARSAPPPVT